RCKHMLAAAIALEAGAGQDEPVHLDLDPEMPPAAALLPQGPAVEPILPEAAFSLSLKVQVLGREGQLTVRGQTVAQFTTHLQAVKALLVELDQAQAPAPTAEPEPVQHYCTLHGPMRPSTKATGQYFCAHKSPDGSWCKAKA